MSDSETDLQMICTDCACQSANETHDDMVKVHVTFDGGFDCILGDDAYSGEFMWAKPTDVENQYEIANIPFFTHDLNLGDVVEAHQTEDYPREVTNRVSVSGNTTLWLFFHPNEVDPEDGYAPVMAELVSDMDEVGREHGQNGFFALTVLEDSELHERLLKRLHLWAANGRLSFLTNDGTSEGFEDLED